METNAFTSSVLQENDSIYRTAVKHTDELN